LSGRGLCDELITRPEESYRLWCVVVCDLETSRIGAPYIYDISHLRVKTKGWSSYREKPNKMQQCIKILLLLILNEAQHVSRDKQPISRSLKLR